MIKKLIFLFFMFIALNVNAITYQQVDQADVTCLNTLYPNITPTSMTNIWSGTADDNVSGNINLGFNFPFNTSTYSNIRVGVNGVIFLGWNGGTAYTSNTIPTNTFNGPVLFPFWNDLYKDNLSSVSYGSSGVSPNRVFVVQYTNMENYAEQSSSAYNTFQVQMWENGDIVYKYTSMNDPGATFTGSTTAGASIGLQVTRSSGLQYSYHTNSVPTGSVILFRPSTSTMPSNSACSTPATSFNAVETSISSGYATGKIYTKLAGTAFTLNIVALNASSNLMTNYSGGSVTASLLDWSGTSPTCSTAPIISGTSNALTFTVADSGDKSTTWTINNSYPIVKVKIVDSTNNVTSCSSDTFSIRPSAFTLTSTKTVLPANVLATYATTIVSGGNVDITYTAVNTSGTTTTNYTGTPITDSASISAHTGAISTGTLNGSLSAGVSGTATSNVSYSETGFVNLGTSSIIDSTFTTTDSTSDCIANSYSNVLSSGKYGCLIANSNSIWLGRFIPDHFEISNIAMTPRNDYTSCAGTYNYIGEDIKWTFDVAAKNSANNTTQNYTGTYNKLNLNASSVYSLKARSTTSLVTNISSSAGSITNGSGSTTLIGNIVRGAPTNTYNADWGVTLTDSDGVDTIPDANLDTVPGNESRLLTSSLAHRYGLLKLNSVVGNNNTQIRVPYQILYRSSNGWKIGADDQCTVFITSNVVLGNLSGISNSNITISSITPTLNGLGYINLKSSASGQGSFEIGFQNGSSLAMCPTFTQGNTSISSSKSYLYSNSCGSNFDKDPRARVSVGIASRNSPIIYWQEKY